MNFLEKLVAEWYAYKGFFVSTNIKFKLLTRGGYGGEMDVIAYKPENHKIIHIETSTDSNTLVKRKQQFTRKFSTAKDHYIKLFPYKGDFEQIAIVGLMKRAPVLGLPGVRVKSIPEFISEISKELSNIDPRKKTIPETYPLLRAIQFSAYSIRRHPRLQE